MNLVTLHERDLDGREQRMSLVEGPRFENELVTPLGMSHLLLLAAADTREVGVYFVRDNGDEEYVSYKQLLARARRRAAALLASALRPGDKVVFLFRDNAEFIVSLWGAIWAGMVPVPLAYPSNFSEANSAMQKLKRVSALLVNPTILTDQQALSNAEEILRIIGEGSRLLDAAQLPDTEEARDPHQPGSIDDLVFIQFSSGSTGDPKGVTLSHRNIINNLEGIIRGAEMTCEERFMSWMPYYHDMGIIGFHFVPVALRCTQVNMTPFRFVRKPTSWMDKVAQHRATVTGSPNFGYKYLLEKTDAESRKAWELSSVKMIFNGAEPISMEVMTQFMQALAPSGLAPEAMYPVYGMAEASLAVTFPPRGALPCVRSVQRSLLVRERVVRHCSASDSDSLRAVEVGRPVPGCAVRIVNDEDELLAEGVVGHVHIFGDNVTRGYWENPEVNERSFCDGWLRTGDLGFVVEGRLCITGRAKDVIFVRGQNFFAYDLEQTISERVGLPQGRLAAVGYHDETAGEERIALFIEKPRASEIEGYRGIWQLVSDVFGIPLDYIVGVKSIPKTTSGKVCRYLLAEDLRAGVFAEDAVSAQALFATSTLELPAIQDSPTEALVRQIWMDVLGNPNLTTLAKSTCFRAVGGTSVKAVQMLERLETALQRTFPQELLLKASSISDLAAALDAAMREDARPKLLNTASARSEEDEDIAIIGLDGMLPDAADLHAYWRALVDGRSAARDLSTAPRFQAYGWEPGRYYAALADSMEDFDAQFFRVSSDEARVMDPQQRAFLQLSFRLLEAAGYGHQRRDGAEIGVFVGASYNAHFEHQLQSMLKDATEDFACWDGNERVRSALLSEWEAKFGTPGAHANVAADNLLNMIAARTAHELNLKGPALSVDTACSSSLVALHLACASLRRRECKLAIAGGVNLLGTASILRVFEKAGLLSRRGQSETFGSAADGLVPGEGAAAVLLKPLKQALADGDCIWAIVRASTINNDGASLSVMAPNPDGQREVMARAYAQAALDPADIQYIEAHATGTPIGDPSELRALRQVFGERPRSVPRAVLGSVKRNVGHLLSAAGIASLLKVVLAMREGVLPPSAGSSAPIGGLERDDSPFELLATSRPWPLSRDGVRRAAINSFGFGGTNCHVILETAATRDTAQETTALPEPLGRVLCLSAPTADGLVRRRQQLAELLETRPEIDLDAVCRTEMVHCSLFEHRWASWATSASQTASQLRDASRPNAAANTKRTLAFLFTGQGSQRAGVGAELHARDARFRRHFDEVAEVCGAELGCDLRALLFDRGADSRLAETEFTQPAVFCVSYALARVLQESGVEPSILLGHSVGEYVAATLASVLTPRDAAWLVARRGLVMRDHGASGGMLALFCDPERLAALLTEHSLAEVWLAGSNGTHVVAAGAQASIDALAGFAEAAAIRCKKLRVSRPFHTPRMEACREAFLRDLSRVEFRAPKLVLLSNVTGQCIGERVTQPEYWAQHMLSPVRFADDVRAAAQSSADLFVEIGPSSTLAGTTRAILSEAGLKADVLPALAKNGVSESENLGTLLSRLFELGAIEELEDVNPNRSKDRVAPASSPLNPKKIDALLRSSNASAALGSRQRGRSSMREWCSRSEWCLSAEQPRVALAPSGVLLIGDSPNTSALRRALESTQVRVLVVSHEALTSGELGPSAGSNVTTWIDARALSSEPITDLALEMERLSATYRAVLAQKQNGTPLRLLVLSRGAFRADAASAAGNPERVLLATLATAAAEEAPELGLQVIDVAEDESVSGIAEAVRVELGLSSDTEHVSLWRSGKRLLRRLVPLVPARASGAGLADGQTLLVTGGAGGVGLALARALSARFRLNFVLVGRSPLSLSETASAAERARVDDLAKALQTLEASGAQVVYESADVGDAEQITSVVRTALQRFGAIDGVIHAAGSVDTEHVAFLRKTPASMQRVLNAKVQGTLNLIRALDGIDLKFFVGFASAAASRSCWAHGLADYAAANAFLDQVCEEQQRLQPKTHWMAINWPLWRGCGMANVPGLSVAARTRGLAELESEQAVQLLSELLDQAHGGVVHVGCALKMPAEAAAPSSQTALSQVRRNETRSGAPSLGVSRGERLAAIEQAICRTIAERLGVAVASVDPRARFSNLGLNSEAAVTVSAELSKTFEQPIAPTVMFEFQTVAELAEYVESVVSPTFRAASEKATRASMTEIDLAPKLESKDDDIAVVGMSCLVPGASSVAAFADLLERGESVIREVPAQRFQTSTYFHANPSASKTYSKWGGFLERPYDFEPAFFGISPREALAMDPQQRLFLEVAWNALADAGYGEHRPRKVGVFVGCEANHYAERFLNGQRYEALLERFVNADWHARLSDTERAELRQTLGAVLEPATLSADAVAGNGLNEIAARVSHCLDLSGPAVTLNTACSSTLVALHWACEALKRGEAELSLVGGVYVAGNATPFIMLSQLQALSPDGKLSPFDAAANGMVLGEGASALVLKPLRAALRDGDTIHAVIRGSAVNNDGHSRGITAPNPAGQAEAIRAAYANCGVKPEDVGYIEAHGTGTALGDPIEIAGLKHVFGEVKSHPIAIGSVKGSIGHMLAAAGGPSLIKAILSVRDGKIFPTAGFSQKSPHLPLEGTSMYIASGAVQSWETQGKRVAGINAFGFGGTNCHVIVEQPPERATPLGAPAPGAGILLLSARTPRARAELAVRTLEHLERVAEDSAPELVASTNRSLRQFPQRLSIVYRNATDLVTKLAAFQRGEQTPGVELGRVQFRQGLAFRFELFDWQPQPAEVERLGAEFLLFQLFFSAFCEHFESNAPLLDARQRASAAASCALAGLLAAAGITPKEVRITTRTRAIAEALITLDNPVLRSPGREAELMRAHSELRAAPLWADALLCEEPAQPGNAGTVLRLTPFVGLTPATTSSAIELATPDVASLLALVQRAFMLGARIDSRAFYFGKVGQMPVSAYPFERESFEAGMAEPEPKLEQPSAVSPATRQGDKDHAVQGAHVPRLNDEQRKRVSQILRSALGGIQG